MRRVLRLLPDESPLALRLQGVNKGLDGYLRVIYGGGMFLGDEELAALELHVRQMNRCYMWLAKHITLVGMYDWAVIPKHH